MPSFFCVKFAIFAFMNERCLLTVIIPVYGVEDTICRALDSVLSTRPYSGEIQVVVVNDGTKDASMDKVNSYRGSSLEILNKSNGGVSSARNAGLKLARGKYVTFLDGDDALCCDTLHWLFDSGTLVRSDYDMIMLQERIAALGVEKYSWQGYLAEGECVSGAELFARGYFRPTVTGVVFRKEFIDATGVVFDEDTVMGEDFTYITAMMALADKVTAFSHILYEIFERPGSASRTFSVQRLRVCRFNLQGIMRLTQRISKERHSSAPLLEYARFRLLMYYAKLSAQYSLRDAFRELEAIIPEGYLPLRMEGIHMDRGKMRLMNCSVRLLFTLLRIQKHLNV